MALLRRKLTIAGLATCLTACTPLDLLNVASGSGQYRTEENVAYGDKPRQTLDIYTPSEPNAAGCRIVFVYGGSWREGDKRDYGFVGAALARRGHEVVIPDYRVYPDVTFPAFVEDIALSVSWYQRRGDERPLVLMGHSAGALITALVSFNPKYLNAQGGQQKNIAALVTLAGPHDYFLPTDNPKWTVIFGENPQQQIRALPVNQVSADAPPTLILHGEEDKIVTPRSAKSLASELERYGVFHQVQTYPDIGHRRLAASIASPLQFLAPTMSDIVAFLDAHVCKSTAS